MKFNMLNIRKSVLKSDFDFPIAGCYLIPIFYYLVSLIYYVVSYGKTYVGGYYLIHYLYTHDHGYIARGLVGEILSWFYDTLTDELLANIMLFINICLALSCSLYIGRMLQCVRKDKHRFSVVFLIVLVFFVYARPITFYFGDVKLDKILWVLTFIAVILSQNKIGIYFVPIICIVATMVNPVFLFCSMILISIILLQEFYLSNYSIKNGIICGVSYISMIALGLLGLVSEKWVGFSTPSEMIDFYFSRYAGTLDEETYQLFETEWLFDYFDSSKEIIRKAYEIYFQDWGNGMETLLNFLLIALPAYILLTIFWIKVIKAEESKFQKFIFFLCAISPVVIIPTTIFSWEFSKYFYNNILMQTGLIIYYITKNSPALMRAIKDFETYCKTHFLQSFIILFYFFIYIAIYSSK